MRDGLSPKDWAAKNDQLLKDLQFKYLEAKVLEEEHDGVTASVTLKNVAGHWLIDGQAIQEERVIGRTIYTPEWSEYVC